MKRCLFAFVIGLYALLAFSATVSEPASGNSTAADPASVVCADDCWLADDTDDSTVPAGSRGSSEQQPNVYTRPADMIVAGFHRIDRPNVRGPPVLLHMS